MTNIEKLLKDKIDWKFFNYLKDKTTSFEDDGDGVVIKIMMDYGMRGFQYAVYEYETNFGEHFNTENLTEEDIKPVFLYEIGFVYNTNNLNKYYDLIKNNCIFINKNAHHNITVKPKN